MKKTKYKRAIACFFLFQASILTAQVSGALDLSFNPGTGPSDEVYSIVVDTANFDRIYLGGRFSNYNGVSSKRIVRLHPDGSRDNTFNPGTGMDGFVYAIALQPDGKILAAGTFTSYNGADYSRIIRLNSDGTPDPSFISGTGVNNYKVLAIGLQPDGKILLAGEFTSYNGIARNDIVRINSDGSIDLSFDPGAGPQNSAGSSDVIHDIAIQPDGKIVIAGAFVSYNGTTRSNIARLNSNGSLDETFIPGEGADGIGVMTVALQTDGKILIGGRFTAYDETPRNYIARVNNDGSLDPTFDPGMGADYIVRDIIIQTDGKIVIAGLFTNYNGIERNYIVRISTDGTLDTTFDPGEGANYYTFCLAEQPDQKILVGGSFSEYNGVIRPRIARVGGNPTIIELLSVFENIHIFPNPTNSLLNIQCPPDINTQLVIINATGQVVRQIQIDKTTTQLDLTDLPVGAYLLRVSSESKTEVFKILKQ